MDDVEVCERENPERELCERAVQSAACGKRDYSRGCVEARKMKLCRKDVEEKEMKRKIHSYVKTVCKMYGHIGERCMYVYMYVCVYVCKKICSYM